MTSQHGTDPFHVQRRLPHVRDQTQLSFISLYVLGTTGCSRVDCLRLLRTNVTMSALALAAPPPLKKLGGSFNFNLDSLQFANVDDGYAIVGEENPLKLNVTLNAAKSWHMVTIQKKATVLDLTSTYDAVYAITAVCTPSGDACRDYRIARSSLDTKKWSSVALPGSSSFEGTGWGFFGKPGAYGSDLWISEQTPKQAVVYFSSNGGRTFTRIKTSRLGSAAGCALTAESAISLWAECPTGLEVSFELSSDAGRSWKLLPTYQFSGTGGGSFDPVSSTLAYLSYGGTRPLVRFSGAALEAATVHSSTCASNGFTIGDVVFANVNDGMGLCVAAGGNSASGHLITTSDGGRRWEKVVQYGAN